jgi:hypothetical protein
MIIYAKRLNLFRFNKIKKEFFNLSQGDSETYINHLKEVSSIIVKAIKNRDYILIDEGLKTLLSGIVIPIVDMPGLIFKNQGQNIRWYQKFFTLPQYLDLSLEKKFYINTIFGRLINDSKMDEDDKTKITEYIIGNLLFYLEDLGNIAMKEESKRATGLINEQIIRTSLIIMEMEKDNKIDDKYDFSSLAVITYNLLVAEIDRGVSGKHLFAYERDKFFESFTLSIGVHKKGKIKDTGMSLIKKLKNERGNTAVSISENIINNLNEILDNKNQNYFYKKLIKEYNPKLENEKIKYMNDNLNSFKDELLKI